MNYNVRNYAIAKVHLVEVTKNLDWSQNSIEFSELLMDLLSIESL